MKTISKALVGAGAVALATLTAAAPAQAQYYPYPQRNGVEEIVRGVAVAGAVSAVVGAIANAARGGTYGYPNSYPQGGYGYPTTYPQGGYGYPTSHPQGGYGYPQGGYGYPQQAYGYGAQGFQQAAVNACSAQAQRYGRVSSIDDVDVRSRSTIRVRGMIEANGGYTKAGYGYGAGVERRTFDCSFRSDGRISNFDTGRVRY